MLCLSIKNVNGGKLLWDKRNKHFRVHCVVVFSPITVYHDMFYSFLVYVMSHFSWKWGELGFLNKWSLIEGAWPPYGSRVLDSILSLGYSLCGVSHVFLISTYVRFLQFLRFLPPPSCVLPECLLPDFSRCNLSGQHSNLLHSLFTVLKCVFPHSDWFTGRDSVRSVKEQIS